jgi:hypothetical protein
MGRRERSKTARKATTTSGDVARRWHAGLLRHSCLSAGRELEAGDFIRVFSKSPHSEGGVPKRGHTRKLEGGSRRYRKLVPGRRKTFGVSKSHQRGFRATPRNLERERARCWRRAAAVPRRRGLSRRRPVGQAQPQRQPQPRAAATMAPGRCASPFGLSRGKRSCPGSTKVWVGAQ